MRIIINQKNETPEYELLLLSIRCLLYVDCALDRLLLLSCALFCLSMMHQMLNILFFLLNLEN